MWRGILGSNHWAAIAPIPTMSTMVEQPTVMDGWMNIQGDVLSYFRVYIIHLGDEGSSWPSALGLLKLRGNRSSPRLQTEMWKIGCLKAWKRRVQANGKKKTSLFFLGRGEWMCPLLLTMVLFLFLLFLFIIFFWGGVVFLL